MTIPEGDDREQYGRLSWSYKVRQGGTDDISIVASSYRVGVVMPSDTIVPLLVWPYGGVVRHPRRAIEVEVNG